MIFQQNDQTLEGSFSFVSTPNFATEYSLEALDAIYKIYILLHRSDLNIPATLRSTSFAISKSDFSKQNAAHFAIFKLSLDEICRTFALVFRKNEKS